MIWVGKLSLAVVLFAFGCSHGVSPGGGGGGGGASTLEPCSVSSSCPTNASGTVQLCDLLYPSSTGGGTCRTSCNPAAPNCPGGEVCNPITAACEPTCTSGSCQSIVAGGANSVCTSGGYCAVLATSVCPSNFATSGAFCKLSNSVSNVPNLSLDPVTNTWELGCSVATDNCEPQLKNLQTSAGTPVVYACSPTTATCVTACDPAASVCTGQNRNFCYLPGGRQTGATCEQNASTGCSNSKLSSMSINPAQSICAVSCKTTADCPSNLFCQAGFCQPPATSGA